MSTLSIPQFFPVGFAKATPLLPHCIMLRAFRTVTRGGTIAVSNQFSFGLGACSVGVVTYQCTKRIPLEEIDEHRCYNLAYSMVWSSGKALGGITEIYGTKALAWFRLSFQSDWEQKKWLEVERIWKESMQDAFFYDFLGNTKLKEEREKWKKDLEDMDEEAARKLENNRKIEEASAIKLKIQQQLVNKEQEAERRCKELQEQLKTNQEQVNQKQAELLYLQSEKEKLAKSAVTEEVLAERKKQNEDLLQKMTEIERARRHAEKQTEQSRKLRNSEFWQLSQQIIWPVACGVGICAGLRLSIPKVVQVVTCTWQALGNASRAAQQIAKANIAGTYKATPRSTKQKILALSGGGLTLLASGKARVQSALFFAASEVEGFCVRVGEKIAKSQDAQNAALTTEIAELHAAEEQLVEENAALTTEIAELHAAEEQLVEENAALTTEIAELHAAEEQLVKENAALTREIAELHAAEEQLVEENAALTTEIAELHAAEEQLVKENAALTREIAELHAAEEQLVEENAALTTEIAKLRSAEQLADENAAFSFLRFLLFYSTMCFFTLMAFAFDRISIVLNLLFFSFVVNSCAAKEQLVKEQVVEGWLEWT